MSRHWYDDPLDSFFDEVIEVHPGLRWVGPVLTPKAGRQRIIVQGYDLTGAMIYLAPEGIRWTSFSEPSQIDPSLKISGSALAAQQTYYARSYHDLAPDQRRAYLEWLAGGRTDPDADRSFVRIYVYGLERRLLVDSAQRSLASQELQAIAVQLIDLEQRYHKRMHQGFLDTLLAVVSALMLPAGEVLPYPPPIDPMNWEEPYLLRYGLGRFSMLNRPIPARWAAVWAWYRRDVVIRSALLSTPAEFVDLFIHHYTEQFGEGLTFKPGKRRIALTYHANNLSIGTIALSFPQVPEVFSRPSAGQKLRTIAEQVWSELGPYARAVSRVYRSDKTLATAALLPPVLQTRDRPEIDEALRWVEDHLCAESTTHIPEEAIVDLWWPRSWDGSPAVQTLASKDRKTLIALLGRFSLGAEPDARYGKRPGLPPANDGLTIFRADGAVPAEPSRAWNSAVVAAQFAAAIVAQDGTFDDAEAARLATEVATAFRTHPTETIRLQVSLHTLAMRDDPVKITGLKTFLDPLTPHQCDRIIDFILEVATRHGTVPPAVVSLVQKIARTLGLDPKEMPSRLFASLSGSSLVTTLPRTPRTGGSAARPRAFTLDHAAIAATEAATAAVADLLGDILGEEAPPVPGEKPPTSSGLAPQTIAGLDAAHSALLVAMATANKDEWSNDALDALAREHHLLGTGAIDALNDAALDLLDEMLIEESPAGFAVDREILATMLGGEVRSD